MIDFLPIILIALITLISNKKGARDFRTPFSIYHCLYFFFAVVFLVVVFFFAVVVLRDVVRVEPVIFLANCCAIVLAK